MHVNLTSSAGTITTSAMFSTVRRLVMEAISPYTPIIMETKTSKIESSTLRSKDVGNLIAGGFNGTFRALSLLHV